MHPAISIRGLTKSYGQFTAVNNLHLDVFPGEILGFLGTNGAGKTTTIRVLLDLLRPTSGGASIFGRDCQTEGLAVRAQTGYLPGEMGLYADMTGREVLDFLASFNRQPVDSKYRSELLDRLDLSGADLRRKIRQYSTGMKRKLGLVQAFQADPQLLILDEPSEGLDPLMQESFYELLAAVKRRGRTVFVSSHVLSEVERVCDRIALLRKGELVLLSTVEETRHIGTRRVRVFFNGDVEPAQVLPPGSTALQMGPRFWELQIEGGLGPLLRMLAALPVDDISVQESKLEEVLLQYYRKDAM